MRLSIDLPGPTWVQPVCPEEKVKMEQYKSPTLMSWAGPWLSQAFVQDMVPKLAVGALAASLLDSVNALWLPLLFALGAWLCDFAVGVGRAVADPDVRLSSEKAKRGVIKAMVIPFILLVPLIAERFTFLLAGWDPAGKYVTVVAAALVWDQAMSVQRNGRFFFRSLVFKRGWFGPDDEGGGPKNAARRMVLEAEAEAARKQIEVGEKLAGLAEREERENGRSA